MRKTEHSDEDLHMNELGQDRDHFLRMCRLAVITTRSNGQDRQRQGKIVLADKLTERSLNLLYVEVVTALRHAQQIPDALTVDFYC